MLLLLILFSHLVLVVVQAPGSSPEMTYVDAPPTTVPPEASYEEDWEVFDPWVKHDDHKMLSLIARPHLKWIYNKTRLLI